LNQRGRPHVSVNAQAASRAEQAMNVPMPVPGTSSLPSVLRQRFGGHEPAGSGCAPERGQNQRAPIAAAAEGARGE
jgi:hypothetical protein